LVGWLAGWVCFRGCGKEQGKNIKRENKEKKKGNEARE
jgi:hypothetical protein